MKLFNKICAALVLACASVSASAGIVTFTDVTMFDTIYGQTHKYTNCIVDDMFEAYSPTPNFTHFYADCESVTSAATVSLPSDGDTVIYFNIRLNSTNYARPFYWCRKVVDNTIYVPSTGTPPDVIKAHSYRLIKFRCGDGSN